MSETVLFAFVASIALIFIIAMIIVVILTSLSIGKIPMTTTSSSFLADE